MAKYEIYFTTGAGMYVNVEADDFDDAIEKAHHEMPSTNFHGNPFDLGDWEVEPEGCYRDGEEIGDSE